MSSRSDLSGARHGVSSKSGPMSLRDPVALGNPVAVEPEDEARLDRGAGRRRRRGVGRAVRVEHRHQRRQSDTNPHARHAQVPEEPSSTEGHRALPCESCPSFVTFAPFATFVSSPCKNCGERTNATRSSLNRNPESRNVVERLPDRLAIRARLEPAERIAKDLLDDALLAGTAARLAPSQSAVALRTPNWPARRSRRCCRSAAPASCWRRHGTRSARCRASGRRHRSSPGRSRSDPSGDDNSSRPGCPCGSACAAASRSGRSTVGSGTSVFTPGGGFGTCWQSSCSRMKMPRAVGEVSTGPAVEVRNEAWPEQARASRARRETHELEFAGRRRHSVELREI